MINEREEFLSYIKFPKYSSASVSDMRYLGRFTFNMLEELIGFHRVLTTIARGYMFETDTPDIEKARRALCAWCSVPEKENATPKEEWQYTSDFKEYHEEFPELVDKNGNGWIVRHVKNVIKYIEKNPNAVSKHAKKEVVKLKEFNKKWKQKVIQFQIEIFSLSTKMQWAIRFDDILADSLVLGALRENEINLPDDILLKIKSNSAENEFDSIKLLIEYYMANRQADTEWVILPVINFDAYFGSNTFSKKIKPYVSKDIIIQDMFSQGLVRYKVNSEYLPNS